MGFGLLNPLLLAGLAALAVPIFVHLVRRDERLGTAFPSLMFVRRVTVQMRRRRTLRHKALLLLRCLALALVVLAFAAPYLTLPPDQHVVLETDHPVVLLLDRSASMGAGPRWSSALRRSEKRIHSLAPNQLAALVVFDKQAEVVAPFTRDHSELRRALAALSPAQQATWLAPALDKANRLLAELKAESATVVLVSDLQRSALRQGDRLWLREGVDLEVEAISDPVGANLAVLSVRQQARSDVAPSAGQATVVARLQNMGDAPQRAGYAALEVNGVARLRQPVALDAGEQRMLELPIVLSKERPTQVSVAVGVDGESDALALDDRYDLVIPATTPISVLIIGADEGWPHRGRFLRQALQVARMPGFEVRTQSVGSLPMGDSLGEALAAADVVVLDEVSVSGADLLYALETFVARGGGLLVIPGAATWNLWAQEEIPFLPGRLGARVDLNTRALMGSESSVGHPLSRRLFEQLGGSLSQVRVSAYRAFEERSADTVIARFGDGSTALLERGYRLGRVVALATVADPRWGSLAVEPGFVPLMQVLMRYLAQRPRLSGQTELDAPVDVMDHLAQLPDGGHAWKAYLRGGGSLQLETPGGARIRLPRGETVFSPEEIGLHFLHHADGVARAIPVAVNAQHAESELDALSEDELIQRLDRTAAGDATGGVDDAASPSAQESRQDLAWYLILVAGVLLCTESVLANRLSVTRAAPGVRATKLTSQ